MRRSVRIALWALFAPLVISIPTISQAAQVADIAGGACISTVSDSTNVTETRTGNDCIIAFKNVATIGWTVPSNILNNTIRILVIGGGGGGNGRTDGTGWVGGGGGGGDYIESTSAIVTPNQNDSVTVGNGGAWGSASTDPSNGGNSVFRDKYIITSIGGGGGGGTGNGPFGSYPNGFAGGSGGGGGTYSGTGGLAVGVGIGHAGGAANTSCCSSGGGGGAGTAGGTNTDANTGGSAGQGLSNSISGSAVYYAGGGAGTGCTTSGAANSAQGGTASNTAGAANTGAGGGGGGANTAAGCNHSTTGAGNGGAGIVIIRYALRTSSASTLPITSNLVLDLQGSNYSGSGSWLDSSGNFYDASILGGVTYSPNDQAFSFDGSFGYMLLNDGPKFQYFNNSPFTLNVMFNPSSISGTRFLFGRFNGGVVGNYYLALSSGTPMAQREIAPWNVYGTTSVVTSNKYFLSYVYDGTSLRLYENGVLDSQTVFSGAVPSGTPVSPLIGASYQSSSPSNFFAGKIYAVNLYSTALTQAQIQQNYAYLLGNGSLGPTLSVPANQVQYRVNGTITATLGNPGKVTFYVKGKKIPGCVSLSPASKYENFTVVCNYKPSLHGNLQITATYVPTITYFPQNLSTVQNFAVIARTGNR